MSALSALISVVSRRSTSRRVVHGSRAAFAAAATVLLAPGLVAIGSGGAAGAAGTVPPASVTTGPQAKPCGALQDPVYSTVDPQAPSTLLTLDPQSQAETGATTGYTTHRGVLFYASSTSAPGLVRIVRLWSDSAQGYNYLPASQPTPAGWQRQGTAFYAAPEKTACTVPLRPYARGQSYAFAASAFDRELAEKYGWAAQPVPFYVAGSSPDRTFTVGVIPDTQTETTASGDTRFADRTAWLVAHHADLDLRYVLHTGDVVNWGWLVPSQYQVASEAMRTLERDGMPYALTVGNHDTRAVGWNGVAGSTGYGGAAYQDNPECPAHLGADQCHSPLLVRHTEEFNAVFDASRYHRVAGAFEAGKVDNIFTTFSAAGRSWLVLTLELWPRTEVVDWARQVVATHPDDNVIVQTHSYLNKSGEINGNNGGYGATSGTYLESRLISQYPNIRMVFSGHVGRRAHRVDDYQATGPDGVTRYRVASFLGNNVTTGTNPVQLVEINASRDVVTSTVRNPAAGGGLSGPTYEVPDMNFLP